MGRLPRRSAGGPGDQILPEQALIHLEGSPGFRIACGPLLKQKDAEVLLQPYQGRRAGTAKVQILRIPLEQAMLHGPRCQVHPKDLENFQFFRTLARAVPRTRPQPERTLPVCPLQSELMEVRNAVVT